MTISFERRTDRPDASGRCTIHLRAYFDNQRLRFGTRERRLASEWHAEKGQFRRTFPGFQEANEYLQSLCVFTEEFIKATDRSESLQHSPLFQIGNKPIFQLSDEQAVYLTGIFDKILAEQSADYHFKNDLIHTYLQLLINEALRMQPTETFFQHKNTSSRITSLFLELLERLFPIESPQQALP
jgi:hypothetical protein